MSQVETVRTSLTHSNLICHIICSGKAVELPGRVTIQYSVHVFSTEDVIFCNDLFVGSLIVEVNIAGCLYSFADTLLIQPTCYIRYNILHGL